MSKTRRAARLAAFCLPLAFATAGRSHAAELTLIAYNGVFNDNYLKAVVEPFEKKTGITVHYYPVLYSAQNLALLRAQKDNPTIDVSIMDAMVARTGDQEGVFATIDPAKVPNMADVYDEGKVNGDYGPAVTFDHYVMIYDTKALNPPPTGLADLWKPEMKGQIAMNAAPDISALMIMLVLDKSLGADYHKTVDPAVRKLADLAPSVQTWQPTPDPYTLVMNGTAKIGTGWNARAQFYHQSSGGRLGVIIPSEGSMFQINTISLVAKAPHPDEAAQFINYALSPEAQKAFTELMYYAPTNKKAVISGDALDRTAAAPQNRAKMEPLDWTFFVANRDKWLEEWRRRIISVR